jgi:hypothetical protein
LLLLYGGAKYERMGVPPDNAQFLETRVFQVRDIARLFKLPPHKLADLADATFSNVEHQNLDYLNSCLRPWLTMWEQELESKLIPRLEKPRELIEHKTEDFLRADTLGRAESYSKQFSIGAITINEIRAAENRNAITGGDEAFVPLNSVPLSRINELIDADIAFKKAKATEADAKATHADAQATQADASAEAIKQGVSTGQSTQAAQDVALKRLAEQEDLLFRERTIALEARSQASAFQTLFERSEHDLAALATAHEVVSQERDRLTVRLQTVTKDAEQLPGLTAARDAALQRVAVLEVETVHVAHQVEQLTEELGTLEETHAGEVARWREDLAGSAVVVQQLTARAELAETVTAELRTQLAQAETIRVDHERTLLEATTARVTAETARQQSETRVETLRRAQTAQIEAHRQLFLEAVGRMVRQEVSKARQHDGSPQKLQRWALSYDVVHAPVCIDAIVPAMRTHLAWMGADQDPVAATTLCVTAHLAEFRRRLMAAIEADPQDFEVILARVLEEWDATRPNEVATVYIQQEIDHVRN